MTHPMYFVLSTLGPSEEVQVKTYIPTSQEDADRRRERFKAIAASGGVCTMRFPRKLFSGEQQRSADRAVFPEGSGQ